MGTSADRAERCTGGGPWADGCCSRSVHFDLLLPCTAGGFRPSPQGWYAVLGACSGLGSAGKLRVAPAAADALGPAPLLCAAWSGASGCGKLALRLHSAAARSACWAVPLAACWLLTAEPACTWRLKAWPARAGAWLGPEDTGADGTACGRSVSTSCCTALRLRGLAGPSSAADACTAWDASPGSVPASWAGYD